MKERRSTTIKKEKTLLALMDAGTNATIACANAGIVPSTFYKWQKEDLIFGAKVDAILYGTIKCGIDKIMAAALEGNVSAWEKKIKSAQKKLDLKFVKRTNKQK